MTKASTKTCSMNINTRAGNHIIIIIISSASTNTNTSSMDINTRTRIYIIIISSSSSNLNSPCTTNMARSSNPQLMLRKSKVQPLQIYHRPFLRSSMYTYDRRNRGIVHSLSARTKMISWRQFPSSASPTTTRAHHIRLSHQRHAPLGVEITVKTDLRASTTRFRRNVKTVHPVVNMSGNLSNVDITPWTPTEAPPTNLRPLTRLIRIPKSSA